MVKNVCKKKLVKMPNWFKLVYCRKKNASLLLNVRLMIFKNDAVVNKNKNLIVLYENSTFFLN